MGKEVIPMKMTYVIGGAVAVVAALVIADKATREKGLKVVKSFGKVTANVACKGLDKVQEGLDKVESKLQK